LYPEKSATSPKSRAIVLALKNLGDSVLHSKIYIPNLGYVLPGTNAGSQLSNAENLGIPVIDEVAVVELLK
jgi:NAD-dependent DNA ligase